LLLALAVTGTACAHEDPVNPAAMVTVQYNCFPTMESGANTRPCHRGNQRLLEKQAGRWVPSRVSVCAWIA
jgi:hypothetical protein